MNKQCSNCGEFKLWRKDRAYFWGGLLFAFASVPWVFIIVGIPFLIVGLCSALAGGVWMVKGGVVECRKCKWRSDLG